jgi:hypothetical protein
MAGKQSTRTSPRKSRSFVPPLSGTEASTAQVLPKRRLPTDILADLSSGEDAYTAICHPSVVQREMPSAAPVSVYVRLSFTRAINWLIRHHGTAQVALTALTARLRLAGPAGRLNRGERYAY